MRGEKNSQDQFIYNFAVEDRIPSDHPLRKIKRNADEILKRMDKKIDSHYSGSGRPSIPPETLLKATILMALYSIRSERQLCEQLEYNFLYRWFLDMQPDDKVPDHSTFSKNRMRLLGADLARQFLFETVRIARKNGLVSEEHFTVDGTLIEAWASLKSFKPKDQATGTDDDSDQGSNPTVNFRGQKRRNDTHQSTTDPEARLMRKGKGKEAKLSYCGNVVMENRNGLCVAAGIWPATGTAEREAALELLAQLKNNKFNPVSLGADKGYHTKDFVRSLCKMKIKPHIARIKDRKTPGLDGRTANSKGYQISLRIRKRVEELFGWAKTVGGIRKARFVGRKKVDSQFLFTMAAANMVLLVGLL